MSSYENMVQIPIKMGSHKFKLPASAENELKCSQLIEQVIAKCRLYGGDKLAKTYAVYESLNGIERRLSRGENVTEIAKSNNSVEFVVRKMTRMEKEVLRHQKESTQSKLAKRCYRKLRQMNENEAKTRVDEVAKIEVYEDIDRDEKLEKNLRERIVENERVLKEQSEKLIALESSIIKHFKTATEKVEF